MKFNTPEKIAALFSENGNATEADYAELQELLDRKFSLCGDQAYDEDYNDVGFSSDIPYEILSEAISGWYSVNTWGSANTWMYSVATCTRKQPVYGIAEIRDEWFRASKSAGLNGFYETSELDGFTWVLNDEEINHDDLPTDEDEETLGDRELEDLGYTKKFYFTMSEVYGELVKMCDTVFEYINFPQDMIVEVEEYMDIHASSGNITLQY